jgi:hypothetical protein
VTADYELQNWARQLSGALDDGAGKVPGFPAQITTRAQLGEIIQRIIWTAGRNMRRSTFRKSISPPSFPMRRA